MSSKEKAPAQYKQPSRKGKKAWRKNVDVTEIASGLETLRQEEIIGYISLLYRISPLHDMANHKICCITEVC